MAFLTYVGNRECLLDTLTTITPYETPMFSSWGKVAVSNHLVQWQTDTLRAATTNASYPGQLLSQTKVTVATSLQNNYTQILQVAYLVEGTQLASNPAGRENELLYQKGKAMKELNLDIEKYIVDSTAKQIHTSAATAGLFGGLDYFLTGNYASGDAVQYATGAAALTKPIIDAQLAIAWKNGAVYMDTLYCPMKQKMVIDAIPATIRKMDESADVLSGLVSIYQSNAGVMKIVLSRFLADSHMYGLDNDSWKIGVLRGFVSSAIPKIVDAECFNILGETTVISNAPLGNTKWDNIG